MLIHNYHCHKGCIFLVYDIHVIQSICFVSKFYDYEINVHLHVGTSVYEHTAWGIKGPY